MVNLVLKESILRRSKVARPFHQHGETKHVVIESDGPVRGMGASGRIAQQIQVVAGHGDNDSASIVYAGLENKSFSDALVTEQSTVVSLKLLAQHRPLLTSIVAHSLWLEVMIGTCIALVLVLALAVCCCSRCHKRWTVERNVNREFNPAAHSALLAHHRGCDLPSWDLFFQGIAAKPSPYNSKWRELMEDQEVAHQIDVAFDAIQGLQPFRKKDVMPWVERMEFEKGSRWHPEDAWVVDQFLEATEYDMRWLLNSWDEIFTGELDRATFHDLFKLIVSWMRYREIKYALYTGETKPPDLPAKYAVLRVNVGSNLTPVEILRYEFDAMHFGCSGSPLSISNVVHQMGTEAVDGASSPSSSSSGKGSPAFKRAPTGGTAMQ